jgi:sulfur relay protein TusB/DsrH
MSSTLFILMKSPHEYHDLDAVAALGGDDRIGVLLFEDAVLFSMFEERRDELMDVADEVYLMGDDLEARGFKGRAGREFQVIDYPRAVDLIMKEFDQTITL